MNKRFFAVLLSFILLFAMIPTAYAAEDTTPPVLDLKSITVDKAEYNTGDTVTIRFKATDSESGVASGSVHIRREGGNCSYIESINAEVQEDGTLKACYTIPKEFVGGTYYISHIFVYDNEGNSKEYYAKAIRKTEVVVNFYVSFIINSDYVPPELPKVLSCKADKAKAKVGDTVTFTVTCSDKKGVTGGQLGLVAHEMPWYLPYTYDVDLTPVAGKKNVLIGKWKITSDIYDAQYWLSKVDVVNAAGVEGDEFVSQLNEKIKNIDISNSKKPVPEKEPVIISFSLSAHALKVGEKLTATAKISCATEYITRLKVFLVHENGRNGFDIELARNSQGVYTGTVQVPIGLKGGNYYTEGVGIGGFIANGNRGPIGILSSLKTPRIDNEVSIIKDGSVNITPLITISGTDNGSIPIGSTFDAMAGVKVTSAYNGDITANTTVMGGTIDTTQPGIFLIKYYVHDAVTIGGEAQEFGYTDYRWIGVTEIMPANTDENLVVTNDSIAIGASQGSVTLKRDGKVIPYAAKVSANGKYSVAAKGASGLTTAGLTGASAASSDMAVMTIDRKGPAISPAWNRTDKKTLRISAGLTDPSGVALSKWLAGKHTLAEVKAGGTVFKGTFSIQKYGVYTVYAIDTQGYESSKVFTVKNIALKKLKLNLTAATWGTGKAVQLKLTFNPTNATDRRVTWKSSNPKVASVDQNGVVRTHKKGKATITARSATGKKVTFKVKVR
jgi:uncharacterized protein YjdB